MGCKVALLLAPGFEEAEAIIILDILERLKINVKTIACHSSKQVKSYHGVSLCADVLLSDQRDQIYDGVILPGGPKGTDNLTKNPLVIEFIKRHDEREKIIAPICSAAAKVLAPHGLLKGRRYVCSGTLHEQVTDGIYVKQRITMDGNLICGQGLGVAFDFAFYLSQHLSSNAKESQTQAEHIYHNISFT